MFFLKRSNYCKWNILGIALFLSTYFNLNAQVDLVGPHNNYTFLADSVQFTWNVQDSDDFYELQLANDITFSSASSYTIYNSDTIISGITVGQRFWRVRSSLNGNFGNWSTIRNFRRINLSNYGTLGLWLDASDLSNLANGAPVSSWADKSLNAYDLSQLTVNLQPKFSVNELGNKPAVYFDGTDEISNLTPNTLGSHFIFFDHSNSTSTICVGLNVVTFSPRFFTALLNQAISTASFTAFTAPNSRRNFSSNLSSPMNSYNLVSGFRTPSPISTYSISPTHSSYGRLNGHVFEIILYQNNITASNVIFVENYLRDKYSPPVSLGKDVSVDYGFCAVNLAADSIYSTYLWSTGETTSNINVTESGTYWLQTTDVLGLISVDTIKVKYKEVPLPLTTLFCPGDEVIWNTGFGPDYTYLWSSGETSEALAINISSIRNVVVTDSLGCQLVSDSIMFEADDYASFVSLGADTSLCAGNTIELISGSSETESYLWSDFSTNNTFIVISSGNVFVQTTSSNGCIANDTMYVTVTGQAPYVDFSAPDQCSNLAVDFTDLSTNIITDPVVSWSWDFGDGNFSNVQNSSHFYGDVGTYNVELFVESQGGCSSQLTKSVIVRQIPNASFSSVGQCSNSNIQFTNTSINGGGSLLSAEWEFGMSGAGLYNFSTEVNPSRIYQDQGSYNVMLIVSDEFGCKDTSIQTKVILQSPTAGFTIEDNCVDAPFECTNTSVVEPFVTYLWNFDDFTNSILENPYKVFSMAGAHEISLSVTAENGCINEFIDTILIHPNPIASYDFGPHCLGTYMELFATTTISTGAVASNNWSINSGNQIVGDTILHFVDLMGQNQVVLTSISDQGCQNVYDQFFNVSEAFDASFSTEGNVVSQGDDFNFTNTTANVTSSSWDFGDGQSSSDLSPIHNFGTAYIDSTLEVLLIAQNSNGCVDSASNTIQVLRPQLDLELQNLYAQNENSFYSVGVRMKNLGSKQIEKVYFLLTTQKGYLFSEEWEGTLLPQESIVHLFSAKPSIGLSDQDDFESFLCVNSVGYDSENQPESNLENNRLCKNLESESIVLLPIYPNPAVDQLTIEFLVTISANVEIDLLDLFGRKVKEIQLNQLFEPGLNTIRLDTSSIESGNYFIRLISEKNQFLQRLVIFH